MCGMHGMERGVFASLFLNPFLGSALISQGFGLIDHRRAWLDLPLYIYLSFSRLAFLTYLSSCFLGKLARLRVNVQYGFRGLELFANWISI